MSAGRVGKVHEPKGPVCDISPLRSTSLLREDWLSRFSKHNCFKEKKSKLHRSCCSCLLPPCQHPGKVCSWETLSQEDVCCPCDCSSRPSPLGGDFFINVCCLCLMCRKCLDFLRLHGMSWKCCCVRACVCPSLKSELWRNYLRIKCWLIKENYFMLKKKNPEPLMLPHIVSG